MAAKIDKKELKEPDPLFAFYQNLLDKIKESKKQIYIGASILFILIAAGAGWYYYNANYEQSAQKTYTAAVDAYLKNISQGKGEKEPGTIPSYEEVIKQYPGSKAAELAHFDLGNLYYKANDYDKSIENYQAFLAKENRKTIRTALAYTGLGYSYEAKKDFEKALAAYEQSTQQEIGDRYESLGYRNMARIYEEMQDNKKAVEFYKKAQEKFKDSSMEMIIKRKIAILG
jgi:tetratricopeptide (TPR) repeat protein